MENRQYFRPTENKVYTNKNGAKYRCLSSNGIDGEMINTESKWRFTAHGCQMYDNGTIEWDYSTGGYFDDGRNKKLYIVTFEYSRSCLKNKSCTK